MTVVNEQFVRLVGCGGACDDNKDTDLDRSRLESSMDTIIIIPMQHR